MPEPEHDGLIRVSEVECEFGRTVAGLPVHPDRPPTIMGVGRADQIELKGRPPFMAILQAASPKTINRLLEYLRATGDGHFRHDASTPKRHAGHH